VVKRNVTRYENFAVNSTPQPMKALVVPLPDKLKQMLSHGVSHTVFILLALTASGCNLLLTFRCSVSFYLRTFCSIPKDRRPHLNRCEIPINPHLLVLMQIVWSNTVLYSSKICHISIRNFSLCVWSQLRLQYTEQ